MARSRRQPHRPDPGPQPAVQRLPAGRTAATAAILVAATFAAYLPSLRGGFIWDDDVYVTRNRALVDPGGLGRIWFEVGATVQYYPLVFTTFWIEQRLWGFKPLGYRVVNVLLHAVSAVLVWIILRRLAVPGALLAAAVFALHPVHVESVAWITERKNVLSLALALGALLAWLRFDEPDRPGPRPRRRRAAYAASLVLFAGGMLSKTVVCSLPAVLVLLAWWRKGRLRVRDLAPLAPMFLLGAGLGLTTVWVEKHVVGAHGEAWSLSAVQRVLVAGRALWFYAGKLIWPHPLMFSYPRWQVDAAVWWQYLFPTAALGLVAGLWSLRSRLGRGPLVAVLTFGGVLFPALGFINVYPMQYSFVADHFQYHASIAMTALLAAAAARAVQAAHERGVFGTPGSIRPAATAAALALLAVLAALTWRQGRIYRDHEGLWRHTLSLNPQAWVAHLNLAKIRHANRDMEGFIAELKEVIRLRPDDANSHKVLGDALVALKRYDEAAGHYRFGLKLVPNDGQMHHNLGNILVHQDRADEAIPHFLECIRQIPNDAAPHYSLGQAYQHLGRLTEAMEAYRASLAINPTWEEAQRCLAWLLATHPDAALRDPEEALKLAASACEKTGRADALYLDTLAAALAAAGRFDEAVRTAAEALSKVDASAEPWLQQAIRHRIQLYQRGLPYVEPRVPGGG